MTTDTSAPTWNATPITGTFGIELTGDELRRGFDPDWLLSLLEEHLLVVIRDQFLTHAEQVQVARAIEIGRAHV